MKQKTSWISLITAILCYLSPMAVGAQENNKNMYEKEWKIIDSLESRGLPASALAELKKLESRINQSTEMDQFVKVVLYKSKFISVMEEEGIVKAINELEQVQQTADLPAKAFVQSMLASFYTSYMYSRIWEISDRTELDTPTQDIRTWTIQDFLDRINELYLASVAEKEALIKLPIADFPAIINEGKESQGLRPTAYDLLVHRAIDYFNTDNPYITRPTYKFELKEQGVFEEVEKFIALTFETQDEKANQLQVILLLQDLLKTRLADTNNLAALIDLDLKRLKLMKSFSVLDDKDERYESALNTLIGKYKDQDAAAEIQFNLAEHYYQQGQNYQREVDETFRWRFKEAFQICNTVKKDYPGSYGAKLCAGLQNQILRTALEFRVEAVNLPQQPILLSLNYTNIDKAYVRVIKITETDENALKRRNQDDRIDYLLNLKPQQEKSYTLPDPSDFRSHTVELMVDPLDYGRYILLVSENDKFEKDDYLTVMAYSSISEIGYMQRRTADGKIEFVVVNRKDGAPMEGVRAEFFISEYNSRKRIHDLINVGESFSDKNGFIQPNVSGRTYWTVKFSKGEDVLHLNDGYRNFNTSDNRKSVFNTTLFLDRAIYRPGQTVYFKGIVLKKDANRIPVIAANQKVELNLLDVNYQVVKKLTLVSNEYGSINGQFIAPGGLTGRMSIVATVNGGRSEKGFRVEEYKRPKFEVEIEDLDKSYALGDEMEVTALAKGFAGNPIDGATVSYTIDRSIEFPWRPYWSRYPVYPQGLTQIAQGEVETDQDGKAKITFEAKPDLSLKTNNPFVYKFRVSIVVTDITGETHEGSRTFRLSELGLLAKIELPAELIDRTASNQLTINTTDLNGTFQPAKGEIEVIPIEVPNQYFADRYWSEPDQFIYDKEIFKQHFPLFSFKGEHLMENWERKDKITTLFFDTKNSKNITLNTQDWDVGVYLLQLKTKDSAGRDIKNSAIITIYDSKTKALPKTYLSWSTLDTTSYQPGEEFDFQTYTNGERLNVYYELGKDREVLNGGWEAIKGWNSKKQSIPEDHRGGLHIQTAFVLNNRFYAETERVPVPWDNKKLEITYTTFRDKLTPGQDEEWQIKISGPENEKVAAEMLATMYDASLDEFASNNWFLSPYPISNLPTGYSGSKWIERHFNANYGDLLTYRPFGGSYSGNRTYPSLSLYGLEYYMDDVVEFVDQAASDNVSLSANYSLRSSAAPPPPPAPEVRSRKAKAESLATEAPVAYDAPNPFEEDIDEEEQAEKGPVGPRTNLKETVFFMPDLKTDEEGNIIIKFKMNEALTSWKFLGLAHTKDLKYVLTEQEVVTQKDLMVLPNPPRFLRQGDELTMTAKVVNLTEEDLSGNATLELFDAVSMQPITATLLGDNGEQAFKVAAKSSTNLAWNIEVPEDYSNAIVFRVMAGAGDFADGEESAFPVLTNKIMVTETLPIALNGKSTKTIKLDQLNEVLSSETARAHQLTFEVTSNPAWLAVKALPYLMEYPYECSEQVFHRFYANSLASHIANRYPKIKAVFDKWKDTPALESNLMKNEELKSALLEETPWVLEAQSEAEQRKNIAILFDTDRINNELYTDLSNLAERQSSDGGFPWFPGGNNNWYITQLIVEGLGHLEYLGVNNAQESRVAANILPGAINFIDQAIMEAYQKLEDAVEKGQTTFEEDHLGYLAIHYLYARSFFPDMTMSEPVALAHNYYQEQAIKYWPKKGLYQQGMIGLALNRNKKPKATEEILASLKERSLKSDELGVYWKYSRSFWWYELPIETHSMLIELFAQAGKDTEFVNNMKLWLLKNKQTNRWETTKSTAVAIFALLDQGGDNNQSDWLAGDEIVKINLPNVKKSAYKEKLQEAEANAEPGTGYYKVSWEKEEINENLTELKIKNKNEGISWGSVYWQYFEQLDQIKSFDQTPLKLNKSIFLEEKGDAGATLKTIKEGVTLTPGNKLVVRIELRVDRDMEFVHMKDMRGSGLEPIEVLSGYNWQGGLGYYQSIRDTGVNFFFDYLPKGTYVFEYPLRVVHQGLYSSGITTIQSMYAPEFSSHSNSVKIEVGN